MMRTFVLAIAAVLMLALAGCGQRGPLYLPDAKNETIEKTTPPAQTQDDDTEKKKHE